MRRWLVLVLLALANSVFGADALVRTGDTLSLGDKSFRLDGVDAPEPDQICLDGSDTVWFCGLEARDRLAASVAGRAVACEDRGADSVYPTRRSGICHVEGEFLTLNQWLVREGWALNSESSTDSRFQTDQARAETDARGLWKGCFVAPWDFRRWNKSSATLRGRGCPAGQDARLLNLLLPDP
jgi:endonuclease YncB( thermonuclease family)